MPDENIALVYVRQKEEAKKYLSQVEMAGLFLVEMPGCAC